MKEHDEKSCACGKKDCWVGVHVLHQCLRFYMFYYFTWVLK